MRKSYVLFLILLVLAFIISGVFIGSMTGQAIRGEIDTISSVEASIFIVIFLLISQVIIILFVKLRREKNIDVKEVLEEAEEG